MPAWELNVAVVGHVEWVQFGRVEHLPRAGEVAHARDAFAEPAGGGAVAAVALARLAGRCALHTVLGEDEEGRRSRERLAELGVAVCECRAAGLAPGASPPTRRAVTLIDEAGERTITTFGPRLDPAGEESAGGRWQGFGGLDATYFTAGDLAALHRARDAARVVVASPRARHALGQGVPLDALVLSADDEIEQAAAGPALADAELVIYTEGAAGGRWHRRDGSEGRWRAAPLPGPLVDSYGAGDTFAAGVTYGLGAGMSLDETLELAAEASARCLTGAGPYGAGGANLP